MRAPSGAGGAVELRAVERGGHAERVGRVVRVERERRGDGAQRRAQTDDGIRRRRRSSRWFRARRRRRSRATRRRAPCCVGSKCRRSMSISATLMLASARSCGDSSPSGIWLSAGSGSPSKVARELGCPPTFALLKSVSANSSPKPPASAVKPAQLALRRHDRERRRLRKDLPRQPRHRLRRARLGHRHLRRPPANGRRVVVVDRVLGRRQSRPACVPSLVSVCVSSSGALVVHLVEHGQALPALERDVADVDAGRARRSACCRWDRWDRDIVRRRRCSAGRRWPGRRRRPA